MRRSDTLSDEEDDDGDKEMKSDGYWHFNDGGHQTEFNISLFGEDLTIQQNPNAVHLGHGAVIWDSSVIFAKYMENNTKEFCCDKIAEKTVLELGSGCGLGGIAFMLKGSRVTFTDLTNVVDELTNVNVHKIFRQVTSRGAGYFACAIHEPKVYALDWTQCFLDDSGSADHALNLSVPYDYILLTDCVFSTQLVPHLIRTIRRSSSSKTTVICCHEIRDKDSNDLFLEELGKYFKYKTQPRSRLHPDFSNKLVQIVIAKMLRTK